MITLTNYSFPEMFFMVQIVLNEPEDGVDENYSIEDVHSDITGTTLLTTWEETLDEPLVQDIGELIEIEIVGDMSFGVTIFEVPLVVKKRYTCIIRINKETGEVVFKWFFPNHQN